jgi:hypothetical protein
MVGFNDCLLKICSVFALFNSPGRPPLNYPRPDSGVHLARLAKRANQTSRVCVWILLPFGSHDVFSRYWLCLHLAVVFAHQEPLHCTVRECRWWWGLFAWRTSPITRGNESPHLEVIWWLITFSAFLRLKGNPFPPSRQFFPPCF